MTIEYHSFNVSLQFRNGMAGGTPVSRSLTGDYARLVQSEQSNVLKQSLVDAGVVTEEAIQKYLEKCSSLFSRDEEGQPCVRHYQVTALLRDASRLLAIWGATGGLLQKTIQNGGVLVPETMPIAGDFRFEERPVAPGGKASIAIFEVVEKARVEFTMRVLQNKALSDDVVQDLWTQAQETGLGSFRHLGYGKFDAVVARV